MLWSSAEVGARAEGLWFAQRLSVLQEPSVDLLQGSFPLCCAWKWTLSARGSPQRVLAVGEVGGSSHGFVFNSIPDSFNPRSEHTAECGAVLILQLGCELQLPVCASCSGNARGRVTFAGARVP